MKKTIVAIGVLAAAFAVPALAGDNVAGMNMPMNSSTMHSPSSSSMTDAEVRKVDAATGMLTLKHGAMENIGMAPMIMAYKAKDASMVEQVHAGDKVKVRVEDVNGTLTIVKLEKRP